jgi:WD40 repeat protein
MALMRSCCVFSIVLAVVLAGRTPGQAPSADRYGDPLPAGAIARLGSVRFLHADWVHSLAFLPDNKGLISAAHEPFFHIWDSITERETGRIGDSDSSILCVALSPDGKLAASADNSGELVVWDIATGKPQFRSRVKHLSHTVAWSPDGKTLAFSDNPRAIHLANPLTGQIVRRLEGGGDQGVSSLTFSPDGKLLASASFRTSFRLWDVAAGTELCKLEGGPDSRGSPRFAPDGKTVAGECAYPVRPGTTRTTVRIWDVLTSKKYRDLDIGLTYCLAFSPDGKLLATGDSNRMIALWDPATGQKVRQWSGNEDRVTALAFSPDGKTLASGGADRRVRLWDPTNGKELRPIEGHSLAVHTVAFSPDGKTLASGAGDGTIRFWDWVTGRELQRCEDVQENWRLGGFRYTPGGKNVVAFTPDAFKGEFSLWDVATGTRRSRCGDLQEQILAFAFMPDTKTLAGTGIESNIGVWDLSTGKLLRRVGKNKGRIYALAPSPDGKAFAWSAWTGKNYGLGLWDALTGKELQSFDWHEQCGNLTFSPDGAVLVTTSRGIQLWEVAAGKLVCEWGEHLGGIGAVAFSPDGTILAVAAGLPDT